MLQLLPNKNKLHNEQSAQSVTEHTAEYKIDNRSVYNILDQICKDTDMYAYVKQHKSKRNRRGTFYVIHSRSLGQNHVNTSASEAKMVLQMSTYDSEKTTTKKSMLPDISSTILSSETSWNMGPKALIQDQWFRYLLNGIRCDKLSIVVTTVSTHPDK